MRELRLGGYNNRELSLLLGVLTCSPSSCDRPPLPGMEALTLDNYSGRRAHNYSNDGHLQLAQNISTVLESRQVMGMMLNKLVVSWCLADIVPRDALFARAVEYRL